MAKRKSDIILHVTFHCYYISEAHGPHFSPEKQFLTIHKPQQSYNYTSTLDKRKKSKNKSKSSFGEKDGPSYVKS